MLGRQAPKVEAMMRTANEDLLAFTGFPRALSPDLVDQPLERVDKEIRRSTDALRVFPNPDALLRLAGAVLIRQQDEWAAADRRYLYDAYGHPHKRRELPRYRHPPRRPRARHGTIAPLT